MSLDLPSPPPCAPGSGRIPVHRSYDLVVIGGGINGAGVARDAALRGLSTLLLDKGDFGGGTTSWSTRLIHGGLRYLETFEFALVRESLREREILLRTAPHLVRPLQLTIPIYRQGQRPPWQIRAGMTLYDLLSFDKSLPNHRMLSAAAFRQLFPQVDAQDLLGAAQYYDGQVVYAERLCLETVLSAQQAGATVVNYAQVTQIEAGPNGIHTLQGQDPITGVPFRLTGLENAIVVATAGPWLDSLLGSLRPGDKPLIGGTKGSHILVEPFPGSPASALYVEAKSDGRPLFVVPWGWENSLLLIGTTDLPYRGNLDTVRATPEEIDYLLQEVNRLFPSAQLTRAQIRFTYSGVRPLPHSQGLKPGQITRSHILKDHASEGIPNLISLIGGKLTTFRQVGQDCVDQVLRKLGKPIPPCPTPTQPFPGAIHLQDPRIAEALRTYAPLLPARTLHHLFTLYGSRALQVLELVAANPDLAEPIAPPGPDIAAQLIFALQTEMAQTLVDLLLRRTTVGIQAHPCQEPMPHILGILRNHAGWDEQRCQTEVVNYRAYLASHC